MGPHLSRDARTCGQRRSAGTGTTWLRTTLLESAWATSHARKSYLGAQSRRISKRRGPKRAAIAVAHTILVIASHVLRDGVAFQDLGPDDFDRMNTGKQQPYHLRRLAELGGDVSQVTSAASIAPQIITF